MNILALDTTTRGGSAALLNDDRVVDERPGDAARSHAERLPAELAALLERHGATFDDIDLFAVASGPGSFTGLRIGSATVQGLALVRRRPVVAVSALEAMAHAVTDRYDAGTTVASWMDAHRHDVFAALYQVGAGERYSRERLVELDEPSVGSPDDVLARWDRRVDLFAGDGAVMYADAIHTRLPAARAVASPLLSAAIGRIALREARAGRIVPAAGLHPLYVRRPDAELDRERRAAALERARSDA